MQEEQAMNTDLSMKELLKIYDSRNQKKCFVKEQKIDLPNWMKPQPKKKDKKVFEEEMRKLEEQIESL